MFKFIVFCLTFELLVTSIVTLSTIDQLVQEAENCETLQTEIHITKDEEFEGRLIRTCSADISVTKCEGYCDSRVQPSVMSSTGFHKECYCCRESYLKKRSIILNECYDADGIKLSGEKGYMEISLDEPAECQCLKCSDFSR